MCRGWEMIQPHWSLFAMAICFISCRCKFQQSRIISDCFSFCALVSPPVKKLCQAWICSLWLTPQTQRQILTAGEHRIQPKCGHSLPPPQGLLHSALILETSELLETWGTWQIFLVPSDCRCLHVLCSFAPTQDHWALFPGVTASGAGLGWHWWLGTVTPSKFFGI